MSLPFWDPGAIDKNGKAQGIVSLIPPNTAPYPDELSSWDFVVLNGVRSPGICKLVGGRHIPYDRKIALGQLVGAAALFAFDPVSFTLAISIWTPTQWNELVELEKIILPPNVPNPVPRAVKAEHPELKRMGLDTIYFAGAAFGTYDGRGLMTFEYQCYEWKPPLALTPQDVQSPLPQGNTPGSPKPTNAVTPPSQGPNLGP